MKGLLFFCLFVPLFIPSIARLVRSNSMDKVIKKRSPDDGTSCIKEKQTAFRVCIHMQLCAIL